MILAGLTCWGLLVCRVVEDGLDWKNWLSSTWSLIPAGYPGCALTGWAGFQENKRELQGHLGPRL